MSLVEVAVTPVDGPLPPAAAELIADARRRIERFINDRRDDPIPAFVPCDFDAAYRALAAVHEAGLAPGDLLCEWGSGFGVVASLAELVGFDACGIEIEGDLVDEAARLAEDHGLSVEFVAGSFIPAGSEEVADHDEAAWLDMGGHDGYEALGYEADEFDVIFAYPWPGEERTIDLLFDRLAACDAVLVTYRDIDGIKVQRKR